MEIKRTPAHIRRQFYNIIDEMANNVDQFVKRPGKDFTRKRICTFQNTILNVMTMESHSLNRELYEYYQMNGELPPTKSAFTQSRNKLNPEAFSHLFSEFNKQIPFSKTYKGIHLLGCDGTDSNIPADKNDLDSFISYNSKQGGYYQNHVVVLYDLLEKRYTDVVIQPRGNMNEIDACCTMMDRNPLAGECLFIADRGFFSFNLLAHACENNQFFLIRLKDINSDTSPFKFHNFPSTDEFDVDIDFILSRRRGKEECQHPEKHKYLRPDRAFDFIAANDKQSSYSISFRLVKIQISEDSSEYLVTNLPRDSFCLNELKELYHLRWRIETSFLFLKYGIAMNYFHSVIREYINQEIFAKLILFNFISLVISCAVVSCNDTKYSYQISISDAIYKCRRFLLNHLPDDVILNLLLRDKTPIRPNRNYKRKMRSQSLKSFQNRT